MGTYPDTDIDPKLFPQPRSLFSHLRRNKEHLSNLPLHNFDPHQCLASSLTTIRLLGLSTRPRFENHWLEILFKRKMIRQHALCLIHVSCTLQRTRIHFYLCQQYMKELADVTKQMTVLREKLFLVNVK